MLSSSRFRMVFFGIAVLALSMVVFLPAWAEPGGGAAAEEALEQIREAAAQQGDYRYTADIEQTLIPRPLPEMIGQTSQRVDLRLDGLVSPPDYSRSDLRFEGGAISGQPLIIETIDGETFLLQDGERTAVENPLSFLGGDSNFLAYLESANKIRPLHNVPDGYTAYGFDIDGPAFANYIHQQTRDKRPADAPLGLAFGPSPLLQRMSGRGEVWLDASGLPRRQIIDLDLPEASPQYNAKVHIVVDFRFAAGAVANGGPAGGGVLPDKLAPLVAVETQEVDASHLAAGVEEPVVEPATSPARPAADPGQLAAVIIECLVMVAAAIVVAALVFRSRNPRLYAGIAISMSLIMIASPLLQAAGMDHFQTRQAEAAPAPSIVEAVTGDQARGDDAELRNAAAPQGLVTSALQDPGVRCGDGDLGADSDGDQLSDSVENCLGTDPYYFDSDRDMITDTVELAGFSFNGMTWYVDPLLGDSNMDGLSDVEEWIAPIGKAESWDGDEDLIPNPWDEDNDNDGVWDSQDLEPFDFTGFQDSFTFTTQIEDDFDGYQYFELQVRPENSDHLRYSTTPLDWPQDEKGQLTDVDGSTEDLTISPMLAVTTHQLPEDDLQELYGIAGFANEDGSTTMYLPLAPVNDGGQIVAFQARLAYGPESLGAISWEEVNLVWLAYMAVDEQVVDAEGRNFINTEIMPVVSYEERFQFTGWNISKHDDYDYLVLGTPSTPNNDRDDFQILFGLSSTFMSNLNPDLDEIDQRFGNSNTDPILTWGVAAADVAVYRPSPAPLHPDGALFDMNREVPRFLNINSYPTDGSMTSLLIATEQRAGETGLSEVEASVSGFDVNLAGVPMATMRHVRMMNFAFGSSGWESVVDDELIDAVIARHTNLAADLAELQSNYPDVTQAHLEKVIGLMYLQWTNGQSRMISADGLTIAPDSTSDLDTYTRLNLGFAELGAYLLGAARLLQAGGGVVIDSPNGMWSYLREEESDEFFAPWWLDWAWSVGRAIWNTNSNAVAWFGMKAILRVIIGIYLFVWAIKTLAAAAKAGVSVLRALFTGFKLASTLKSLGSWALTLAAVALYLVLFAISMGTANNKYERLYAVAFYAVTIVFTLVLALISFIPGGTILLALIYLADLIVFAITGESFLEEMYQAIADAIYNFDFVTSLKSARFGSVEAAITNDAALREGSIVKLSSRFAGEIEGNKNARVDDVENSYTYGELTGDNASNLSVTVVDQNQTQTTLPDAANRTCTRRDKVLKCNNQAGVSYQFNESGRNIAVTLDADIKAVTVVRECTFGNCEYPTEALNLPDDLDSGGWRASTLYFDVVPDTLDELWAWNEINNLDRDGDSLTDSEENALGTSPTQWDTDGDGLGDDFEYFNATTYGTDPLDEDSDDDGLTDGQEFRWATLIDTADSDGDGLSDAAEIFHQLGDDSWSGGGWLVTLPGGGSHWIFSSPVDDDEDLDGLSDASEKDYQSSPFAFNTAPQLRLTADPLAISPSGATGIYVAPGDQVRLNLTLENLGVRPVTDTLSLCLPGMLGSAQGGVMQGWQTPPAQTGANCFSWAFSGANTLQRWESVNTTITTTATTPAGADVVVASLPYTLATSGTVTQTVAVVVDDDQPVATITNPADDQIIGGGVTSYIVGGTSDDPSSWVDHMEVTLPGQGTVVITETTSPWAASWDLAAAGNGLLTLSAQAVDFTGHSSLVDSVQVLVDNYSPAAALDLLDGQTIAGSGGYQVVIPLSGSASDDDPAATAESGLERIQLSLDDAPWRTVWTDVAYPLSASWSVTWTLPGGETVQGEHVVKTRAYDRAGNLSSVVEKTIVVDVLPPTDNQADRTLLTDPPHYQSGASINLQGVANDAGNLSLAPVPQDLVGTLQSVGEATIWLQADSFADISNNMTAAWLGDFNGDRLADLAVGLPAANDGAGKVVVVLGAAGDWPVPDLGRALADSTTSFTGVTGAGLGQLIAPAGDVNGDGFADMLIGDQNNDRAFLVFGSLSGRGNDVVLDGHKQSGWVELTTGAAANIQDVAAAGDVNGDGFDDLLMSVDSNGGEAYLLLGESAPPWSTLDMESIAAAVISTASPATAAGVGDVNDDQLADYALGAGSAVYLFAGEIGLANFGRAPIATADALATFASSDGQPDIVPLGPVNGDGHDDFIFGNGSSPTVVFGNTLSTQALGSFSPAASGFLAAAGDVDRDGRNDILLGNAAGDAYLVAGSDLSAVAATFTGVDAAASAPYTAGADLNSDGASDLLLVPSASAANAVGLQGLSAPAYIDPAWLPQAAGESVQGGVTSLKGLELQSAEAGLLMAGTTRYVDDDGNCQGQTPCYSSAQAAVNASAAGDVIELLPGVYSSFTVSGTDNLTIQGASLTDATFVDGAGGTFAIKVSNVDGLHLSDLTLRDAQYGLWLETAGESGWKTPAAKTTVQRLFIHDFTSHAIYMNRQSTLDLAQTTLAGSTNHIGVYGLSSSAANWDGGISDSRFANYAGGAMLQGSNKLYLVHGNGGKVTNTYNPSSGAWGSIANAPYKIGGNSTVTIDENDDLWLARANDFGAGLNGRVRAVEYVADDQIYVGGNFTQAGGRTAEYVAMWNGSSWESLGVSDSNRPDQQVRALAYDPVNDVLYVGTGQEGNSQTNAFLRSWNGSSWTKVGTLKNEVNLNDRDPGNALVNALVYHSGVVWIGGNFDKVQKTGGSSIKLNSITKYTASSGSFGKVGNMDNRCDPGIGHQNSSRGVTTIAVDNSYIYIGGDADEYEDWHPNFDICFPHPTGNVTRISKSSNQFTGLPFEDNASQCCPNASFIYNSANPSGLAIHSIARTGSRLVIGGAFTGIQDANNPDNYDYSSNNLLILDVSGATTVSIDSRWNMNGTVRSVSARNNRIFAAGDFTTARIWGGTSVNANRIAFINNNNVVSAMDGGLSSSNSNPVVDHGNSNTTVFIGGNFTTVDGGNLATNHFARWESNEFSGQGFFQYDNSANTWNGKTSPSVSFGPGAVLESDGSGGIYAMRGDGSSDFLRYSTGGNTWSSASSLPGAASAGATMTAVDDDIYAFRGGANSDFCRYDGPLPGLIGHWNLDEGSGTTATDLVGGNNGTLLGGPNYVNDVPANITFSNPYAVNLDGNNDRIEIANESAFDLNQLTVSFWMKVDAFDIDWQAMVTKGDSAWRVARNGATNQLNFATNGLSAFSVASNASLNTGQWYHVVVMYDGSMKYIYIDGSLDRSVAATGTISTNDYPVMIGENAERTGRNFDGKIDDVRIYSRALSPDEIAALSSTTTGTIGWDCNLSDLPGSLATGPGASLVWDGQDDIFAVPGSNGKQFYTYSIADDSWTTLGDGSGITSGDDDTPSAVNAGAGLAISGTTILLAPGGGVGALYGYGPVGQIEQRLEMSDVAIVAPNTSSASTWINTSPSKSFSMTAANLALVAGPSTNWTPDLSGDGITPSEASHSQAAFLDSSRDLYRLTSSSVITAGYHTYRPDAIVATSGREFSSIQAAINSGANQVRVETGAYEEDFYLVSGVTVVGSGGSHSLVQPPVSGAAPALVNAEGVAGATLRGFTLDGADSVIGVNVEDGASDVKLARNIIHHSTTGITLDGRDTEVEVVNLTVANNTNGLVAANCAPVDVRNSIFAHNSGNGLRYDGCAPTKLHTYNDYWANGTDLTPLAPGSGEIFLNPLFTDFENYLVDEASPIIDAGAPGDPSPPGTGDRVDMGYVEQVGASFYADDDYCATCENDGLTWGVDAFKVIQDALDAAEAELLLLGTDQARFTVGVGPGAYFQTLVVPSYVSLVGSGAEDTAILGEVVFRGSVHAGVHNFTLDGPTAAVAMSQHANNISVTGNILSGNTYGVLALQSTAVEIMFNTITGSSAAAVLTDISDGWAVVENNIMANNGSGLWARGGTQIFGDYNLLFNATDYRGVPAGANDITGQDPGFDSPGYRLLPTSPAIDTADPTQPIETGGGQRADMGYWELRARPFTVFLGDDNVSTAVAFSGIGQVEYGVVRVVDPSSPLTSTLPASWNIATLDNPNANVSGWSATYAPPSAGYYRFYTRAADVVNNQETDVDDWFAGSFYVDDAAPVVNILSPANSATTAESLELRAEVSDYVASAFAVEEFNFLLDGVPVAAEWAAEPWSEDGVSSRTFRSWVDVAAGSHTLAAVAEDKAGNVGQSSVISFTASAGPLNDTTNPSLSIKTPAAGGSWFTGTVVFTGTASDAGSGLAAVEASFDAGVSWQPAEIISDSWSLTYDLAGQDEIEHVSYRVRVRATDKVGNRATASRSIIVDNVPPHSLLPVSFSAPPGTHFDAPATLTTTWSSPLDGSGVANVLLAVDNFTDTFPSAPAVGNSAASLLGANQDWYVHIAAVDIAGNSILEHFGPWQVGSTDVFTDPLAIRQQTIEIDGYIDESLAEWTDDEKLDDDERGQNHPTREIQSLYATWDGVSLYLGWKGAWWKTDGTFWAYLDTGAGGTTTLVNGTVPDILPFEADLAVSITEPDAGLLWTYNGASWTSSALTIVAQGSNGHTELAIPLAVDTVGTLRLVAFADENDTVGPSPSPIVSRAPAALGLNAAGIFDAGIKPWSVFPTTNKLDMLWDSFYEWSGLSTVVEINAGQPTAPDVSLDLTSPQPFHSTSGPGDTITYWLALNNQEQETVAGLQARMEVDANLTLQTVSGATCANCASADNWLLDLPAIAAGGTHSVTVTALLASDLQGTVQVSATAALLSGADVLGTDDLIHAVDGDAPSVTVSLPPGSAIGPGPQTVFGTAADGLLGGGVAVVEVREGGGSWQAAAGTEAWSAQVNVSVPSGAWSMEVRATDVHGLVSPAQTVTFNVDVVAPVITPTLPAIVSGGSAVLTGLAHDIYPAGSEVAAVDAQIDGATPLLPATVLSPNPDGAQNWLLNWALPVEDGVDHSLVFSATDQVGNVGFSPPVTVTVDNVAPSIAVTQARGLAEFSVPTTVMTGTVGDGLGVSRVLVSVYLPDGSAYDQAALISGDQWAFAPSNLPLLGSYHLWLTAEDIAGNETVIGPYELLVVSPLTIGDVAIDEFAGTVTITVTAQYSSLLDVSIDYTTVDGAALEPDDYQATSGSLDIPAGQLTGQITVPIVNDRLDEPDETFGVLLSNAVHALIADGDAQVTIIDDDTTPVAVDDTYGTPLNTVLSVPAPGVLENDSDEDGDDILAVLSSDVTTGTLSLSADGSFIYTPTLNFFGDVNFHYLASDGVNDSAVVTVTITVNDIPELTVEPVTATVQYSDQTPFMVTAEDDDATLLTFTEQGLPPDLFLDPDYCASAQLGITCTILVSGTVNTLPGTYPISVSVSDSLITTTQAITLFVESEDAVVKFDDDNPVAVLVTEPESNASEPFSLLVTVTELEPDSPDEYAAPGDISKAQVSVTLAPIGPGGSVTTTCTEVSVTGTGYDSELTVTCDFADVPVNTYSVLTTVHGGYYVGSGEDVVVVYDPSLGFTTGGGWFYWPGTADPGSGYPGDKTNFGYNMSYNTKNLRNVKGNLLLIRHLPDGTIYRVKSNALEGLSIGDAGAFGWASFTGKATYLYPDSPFYPEPEGNHSFVAYVEDHNEPGTGIDEFWIEVHDKDGQVLPDLSLARPGSANAVPIQGGNIVVPHSGGNSSQPPSADFTFSTSGLLAEFTDQSSDPGGVIVSWDWDFGDGNTSTEQNPTHTYSAAGGYDVTLTVTDDEGELDSATRQVTVSDASGAAAMHIGDLLGWSIDDGSNWIAFVTITVLDQNENPVPNATVTGIWSKGDIDTSACLTDANGQCTVEQTGISDRTRRVTFTVDSVSHTTLIYDPGANAESELRVDRP